MTLPCFLDAIASLELGYDSNRDSKKQLFDVIASRRLLVLFISKTETDHVTNSEFRSSGGGWTNSTSFEIIEPILSPKYRKIEDDLDYHHNVSSFAKKQKFTENIRTHDHNLKIKGNH